MPITWFEEINAHSSWAVWKIDESYEEFMAMVNLDNNDNEALSQISHPVKILEWFGSRLTIKYLLNKIGLEFAGIIKDRYNKPFLKDVAWHISISHSFPYATAIIHSQKPVGIDIELPRSKVISISNKFLNRLELEFGGDNIELLSIMWSAKEVLYKLYGRKELTFRENLFIAPFDYLKNGHFKATMLLGEEETVIYNLKYSQINGHYVVFNL